jgi:hypothetical protein
LYFKKIKKGSIVVWIVNLSGNMVPLLVNFQYSKFDANKKCFCMFKTSKYVECTTFFFQTFLSNVHHSFLKLKRILTLMIKGTKINKIDEFFLQHIWIQWFKSHFGFKNYEFWACDFNKNYSFVCDKRYECIVCMIEDQDVVQNIYI